MTTAAAQDKLIWRKTKGRTPHLIAAKQPLDPGVFYSIREITDKSSPHYQVSPATLYRALNSGALKANYVGRKVLLKGSAIQAWIEGGGR